MSRVLVVEDSEQLGRLLAVTLARAGHDAQWCATAQQALAAAADNPPDVALVDLHLADESGPDVAAGLRERWPDVRVIALSGEVPAEPIAAQFDLFLLKPVALVTLLAAISPP